MLIWAREQGCPWEEVQPDEDDAIGWENWTPHCCALAAKGGHLQVLKWLRCGEEEDDGPMLATDSVDENACPWDEWTCAYAAAGGSLEVLQWARAHGCPWDQRAFVGSC